MHVHVTFMLHACSMYACSRMLACMKVHVKCKLLTPNIAVKLHVTCLEHAWHFFQGIHLPSLQEQV